MAFNSIEYCLFLGLTWLAYSVTGRAYRWLTLLIASYLFYASLQTGYLLLVLFIVTVNTYLCGLRIGNVATHNKRSYLIGAIVVNTGILVFLKYIPFIADNLKRLLPSLVSIGPMESVPLFVTIGVSYYVFQSIAYVSDIYLEIEDPEPHFGYLALSLAFFPKLLQGPIERAGDILPQIRQPGLFDAENIRFGMLLFLWGMFKKVVIADNLGIYVDGVYGGAGANNGLSVLFATYAYAFQIYFDFSGYTDMALGVARLFNIKLTNNFNQPYLATSVADFWRRWHISFSRFILDYIFKPLQMRWRRGKNLGTSAALMITFFVSGVWHGANWTFILWGTLHGAALVCSIFYRPVQKRLHKILGIEKTSLLKVLQILFTFHLICLFWVFFRAHTVEQALQMVMAIGQWSTLTQLAKWLHHLLTGGQLITMIINSPHLLIMLLLFVNMFIFKISITTIKNKPIVVRWTLYYLLIFSIFLFSSHQQIDFIYLQF